MLPTSKKYEGHIVFVWFVCLFVLVARLNVRLTGDHEVAGLIHARSATFFRGDLIMKYFLQSFSPIC